MPPATAGLLTCRLVVGGFLVPAAVAKLRYQSAFAAGVREYALVPDRAVRPLSLILPAGELLIGLALVVGVAAPFTSSLAAALLAMFTAAIGINVYRKRQMDCHCHGIATTKRIGAAVLLRNVALITAASTAATLSATGSPPDGWVRPDAWGWTAITSVGDALLVAILVSTSALLVYLLEWSIDEAAQARSASIFVRGEP